MSDQINSCTSKTKKRNFSQFDEQEDLESSFNLSSKLKSLKLNDSGKKRKEHIPWFCRLVIYKFLNFKMDIIIRIQNLSMYEKKKVLQYHHLLY